MDSSQDHCKGDTKYGRTALYKGKSDSIIMRVSSLEKELLSESLMQRVGSRKSVSTAPFRKSSYPMQASDDSSTPISFSNVLSRTSSTASLSLGVAGPLIFPSDHALASIVNGGSSTSRGEVSSDEADIAYPVGAKYRINPQNVACGNDVQIDIENDCKSVPLPPPPPISLKFVDVKYKVDVCKEDGLLQVWRNVSRAAVAGRFKLTQKKKEEEEMMREESKDEMKQTGKVVVSDAAGEEGRWIVKGITGSVEAGEVLALMGPSGSGKTTLLSLLSGRLQPHHHHVITYNDLPYSKSLKPRMGFVMQDDVLYPHLTVKETLMYAALLRLPKNLSKTERMERVMEVIYELGLERCQNTIIGGPFLRGVSGGERKRVCMGQEILVDPSLLFLDEPTSGLDSATAFRIVYMLQKISKVGRTVVTTIHQPSSRIFHMFDKVILLSEGHLLYYGKASTVMNYFSSIGFSPQIAMNPADFLLDLASGDVVNTSLPSKFLDQQSDYTSTKSQGHESAAVNLPSSTRPSPKNVREYLYKSYETTLREKSGTFDKLDVEKLIKHEHQMENFYSTWPEREWGASWWSQFCVLYVRGLRERRHEYLSFLRIMQVLASAFIIGCLWWHSSFHTERQLADQVGLLFFIATYWGFFPLFTALFTFPLERAILAKERASDMYRLSAYFMARTLGDIPLDFCLPLLFHIIVYFMAHLQPRTSTFFLTLLTTLLDTIASQGMGIAIGAVMMDLKKATTLASVTLLTFMLSGGYFVQGIPKFISWIRYLSYNYHTFKLLIKVQYNVNQEFDCNTTMGCQKVVDSPILQNMSLDGGAAQEVFVLLLMIFGYRLIAYVALRHMRLAI